MSAELLKVERMECEPGCGFTLEVSNMGESMTDELWSVPRVHLVVHPDHVHLSGLYVPIEMRRLGLARGLMQWAMRYVEQQGLAKVPLMLDARPYGEAAPERDVLVKFYEALGFTRWPHHPTSMVLWPKEERA